MAKKAKVAIIGLGYVGLPLARLFVQKGHHVIGIDLDARKIEKLHARKSYLSDLGDGDIEEMFRNGRFLATEKYDKIADADFVIICVPTPIREKEPDLSYIQSAVEKMKPYLKKDQVIVLESSTYPGTTEEIVKTKLEKQGFQIGKDLFLGYSPERIDPGNKGTPVERIPKIISGVTPQCLKRVSEFYESVFETVVPVSSPKAAEFAKMLENCQRWVNISLVNEMNILANKLNVNLWEVIRAAKTKPWGFVPYYPGSGAGGHCIPVDPYFMIWLGMREGVHLSLLSQAGVVNEMMPHFVVRRLAEALRERGKSLSGAKIGGIGITYKKDVNDIRESTSLKVISLLLQQDAEVKVFDPIYRGPLPFEVEWFEPVPAQLTRLDAVVILVDHSGVDYRQIVNHSRLVLDTRNVTEGMVEPHLIRL